MNTVKNSYNIAGIDEAGRGCVLGPIVMAICVIDKEKESFFKEIGVKDSKLLSKPKREELFKVIQENSTAYSISVTSAAELNILMDRYSLNEIEAIKATEMMLDVAKKCKDIKEIIIDCPDTIPDKFKNRIINNLDNKISIFKDTNIKSEHKADMNHIVVGCASILAKVTRDNILREILGNDLSGYSSDPKTIDFLKKYILEHKKVPVYARTKWKTIDNIMNELYQRKLGWFNEKK